MSDQVAAVQRVIGVEEHAWTADLRDALLKFGGDDTVTMMSSQQDIDRQLRDVGDERLARMDAAGVDLQVLSITTPGTQPLPPGEAVPLARDANDFLADAVRRRPDRLAAAELARTPEAASAGTTGPGNSRRPRRSVRRTRQSSLTSTPSDSCCVKHPDERRSALRTSRDAKEARRQPAPSQHQPRKPLTD